MRKTVDLLNGNIVKSLTELAVPIMATSMVQMAYNLTDMAWIGRIGSAAVTSVGAAGMYTWLSQGVVMLARMGGQVKVAHSLGEGKKKKAVQYGRGAIQLAIVLAVIYGIIMNLFTPQLIGFFGLQTDKIVGDAVIYLRIAGGLIIFAYLNQTLTGLFTAIGNSRAPFTANCVGLLCNMVMDPILIFGIGPFPRMEAAGAAAATVMAQAVVTFVMFLMAKKDQILFNKIKLWEKTPFPYFVTMIKIGLPTSVQDMLYCTISMLLTRMVASWGDTAVAVQRVGGQIESISWMTAEGFGTALNAFVGQNFGGKKYDRIRKGYFTAAGLIAVWGLFTTGLLVFLSEPIFRIFIHEPDVIPHGVSYLKIIGYGQLFMCVELMTVGALAGLGKTFICSAISITLTSSRIPLALLFGATALGLNGIWWALTTSSILKGITFFLTFVFILSRLPDKKTE
ncbi:MATE family efflux transporter [Lachnoclostridium edouardi]|uniref:MATE family efflux transporter n=1 Tax=Lachnoclostridium edouardi TaxID=1926283 RepID=UPI000C7D2DD3|nr:MATE family efflux transporter [Lachnoclostridium edouardi]